MSMKASEYTHIYKVIATALRTQLAPQGRKRLIPEIVEANNEHNVMKRIDKCRIDNFLNSIFPQLLPFQLSESACLFLVCSNK